MLLITELDEKNSKYRERLEELGIEVSSNDEDEGESDTDSDISENET